LKTLNHALSIYLSMDPKQSVPFATNLLQIAATELNLLHIKQTSSIYI